MIRLFVCRKKRRPIPLIFFKKKKLLRGSLTLSLTLSLTGGEQEMIHM